MLRVVFKVPHTTSFMGVVCRMWDYKCGFKRAYLKKRGLVGDSIEGGGGGGNNLHPPLDKTLCMCEFSTR